MSKIAGKVMAHPLTDEEFEKLWEQVERQNERQNVAWEALSEEENELYFLNYTSTPANERITGVELRRHRGADGKWVYEWVSEYTEDNEPRIDEDGIMHL